MSRRRRRPTVWTRAKAWLLADQNWLWMLLTVTVVGAVSIGIGLLAEVSSHVH